MPLLFIHGRICETARAELGVRINFHGDELNATGSAELAGDMHAAAVSHLEEVHARAHSSAIGISGVASGHRGDGGGRHSRCIAANNRIHAAIACAARARSHQSRRAGGPRQ
jgi:hypothetical protein